MIQSNNNDDEELSQNKGTSNGGANVRLGCEVLLNNFRIKKKRYRVLLNNDHIVWQHLDAKRNIDGSDGNKVSTADRKEAELEEEQLSKKALYGRSSNVLNISEIIRVSTGISKAASFRNALKQQNPEADAGAPPAPSGTPTEQYLTIHYAERIVRSSTDCNRWHVRVLTLYNSDPYIVHQWDTHLRELLQRVAHKRIQRLLVFINPHGGRKQGLQIYERSCKPIIQLAGIDASCIVTQRANQIRDILIWHDLSPYDAVCCVGGDGTVAEMINGIIMRSMRDHGLDLRHPKYIPKPRLPVGIIPAGSTDTIAYSLHGTSDVRTAAIHLVLGQRRGLDICSVRNREGLLRFCASVLAYGYLGDVAAKSEDYRWMGTKRYEFAGVRSFLLNRSYEAEVRLLLREHDDELDRGDGELADCPMESICYANCQRCSTLSTPEVNHRSRDDVTVEEGMVYDTNAASSSSSSSSSSNLSLHAPSRTDDNEISPPSDSDMCDNRNVRNIDREDCDKHSNTQLETNNDDNKIPPAHSTHSPSSMADNVTGHQECGTHNQVKWHIIKGEFFMINGANIACACTRSPNGISRYCHLGDGHLDLVLVRKTSLLNNLRLVVNSLGRSGDIRKLPFVEVYRTRQFSCRTLYSSFGEGYTSTHGSCQPIAEFGADARRPSSKSFSSWNCDGEVVTDLELTMTSHCQLIDVFMRGPYPYSEGSINVSRNSVLCCCRSNT